MKTNGSKFQHQLSKLYNGDSVGNFGTLKLSKTELDLISKALIDTKIRNLNLYGTLTNSSSIKKLKNLKVSKLVSLNCYCNALGDDGTFILLNSMPMTLSYLNLCNNGITEDGAYYIATFLSQNPLLLQLDLSFNALRAIGAKEILRALISNTHLLKLNLHRNSINEDIRNVLDQLVSANTRLTALNLDYNPLTSSTLSLCKSLNSKNKELQRKEALGLKDQFDLSRKLLLLKHVLPLEMMMAMMNVESVMYGKDCITKITDVVVYLLDRSLIGTLDSSFSFSPMNLIRQVKFLKLSKV